MTIESLKSEVLKLDKLERIAFVQFILESLAEEEREITELSDLSAEEKAVVLDRIEAIKSGTIKTVSHKDVEDRIRNKYGFDD